MTTYEVEMKFRVPRPVELLEAIRRLGAVEIGRIRQEDHYLSHPARDFVQTGEALRLRVDGDDLKITYKGPKLGGPAKTREEIEMDLGRGIASLPEASRLFALLGFRPVAVVGKNRFAFELDRGRRFHLAMDEVDGLGSFAEVETIAVGDGDVADAQRSVVELAEELELTDREPRSYLRMLIESRA